LTVQTSRLVQDPYVSGPNPLEWDPTPPPPVWGPDRPQWGPKTLLKAQAGVQS
jgi:hypothetical protein